MSGHSHFATIKRQKETKDAAKGKAFSKMAKAITIAVKTGGGSDPSGNYKLRIAIDQARSVNMPKSNIERAISNAQSSGNLEEITYEGYGPFGIGVVVETATDNKNRTAQEIKNLFEKNGGGALAGPGSVSYNFERKGFLSIKKTENSDELILKLIDMGIDDVVEEEGFLYIYVDPQKLEEIKEGVVAVGMDVDSFGVELKPKNLIAVDEPEKAAKVIKFLNALDDYEEVQNVYSNADLPEGIAKEFAN